MVKLTKAQKDQVVMALMGQAGNLAEFWGEMGLADVPQAAGVDYLASLMCRMPGDAWDIRLPEKKT